MERGFWGHLKRPIIFIPLIVILLIAGGILFSGGGSDTGEITSVAERRDLKQIVSVTGIVKPASSVVLAFERGGKVRRVYSDVGESVGSGEVLASLENADFAAAYDQAVASVKAREARLSELLAGGSPQSIAVAEIKLQNAQAALRDAEKDAFNALREVVTSIDDVIKNKADGFFSNPQSSFPTFKYSAGFSLKNSLENQRVSLRDVLEEATAFPEVLTESFDFDARLARGESDLKQVQTFLGTLATAVNSLQPSTDLSQATIDAHKATVSSARGTIDTKITEVTGAKQAIRSATSAVALEESQLALAKSPARAEEIQAQEAEVEQAKANAANAAAILAKTVLRSPIAGIVTERTIEEGEIVSAGSPVFSVISEEAFIIEVNIPEVDISKVKVGDRAEVTLDAYGRDVVFETVVVSVNPAETVIEGVATYKVTLQFVEDDERVRSGMTANTGIISETRNDVVAVPQRAVIRRDGRKIIRVREGENVVERDVVTGILGENGLIEVVEGVEDGEEIIVFSGE